MSLKAAIGKALDGIVAADPALSAFGKLKGSGRLPDLALLHAARGEQSEARTRASAWVATLPRQIERPLDRLLRAGVLTATEHAILGRASLQAEDRYRELVAGFVPGGLAQRGDRS